MLKKLSFLLITVIFIFSCGLEYVIPTPDTDKIKIITGENEMLKRIGEEFDVKVSIINPTEVIGLNSWITFNPLIIEAVDGNPATSGSTEVVKTDLGFFSDPQLLVNVQEDAGGNEQPGTLICGYVSMTATPVSIGGDCFSVRFRAIASGETDIEFAVGHLNLQDIDGDIPTDSESDSVEIPVNAVVKITVL